MQAFPPWATTASVSKRINSNSRFIAHLPACHSGKVLAEVVTIDRSHWLGGGKVRAVVKVKLRADSAAISICLFPVSAPPIKPAPAPARAPMPAPLPPPAIAPISAPPAAPPPVVAAVLFPFPL